MLRSYSRLQCRCRLRHSSSFSECLPERLWVANVRFHRKYKGSFSIVTSRKVRNRLHQASNRLLQRDRLGRIFLHLLTSLLVNCRTLLRCFSVDDDKFDESWRDCARAWRTIPTNRSSTLWLRTRDISTYLQLNLVATFSPSW